VGRLASKSPCAGILPVEVEGCRLVEMHPEAIVSVAPYRGQEDAVSRALDREIGVPFPAPNRFVQKRTVRAVWAGPSLAMVIGARVEPANAAVTDQTDAWSIMQLDGPLAVDVLARLVPVDLRLSRFQCGEVVQTLLHKVNCGIARVHEATFEIMAFRSMSNTAVGDLAVAMKCVAARTRMPTRQPLASAP